MGRGKHSFSVSTENGHITRQPGGEDCYVTPDTWETALIIKIRRPIVTPAGKVSCIVVSTDGRILVGWNLSRLDSRPDELSRENWKPTFFFDDHVIYARLPKRIIPPADEIYAAVFKSGLHRPADQKAIDHVQLLVADESAWPESRGQIAWQMYLGPGSIVEVHRYKNNVAQPIETLQAVRGVVITEKKKALDAFVI